MARFIRASEIGEYLYCSRAWWLRQVAGVEPAGQARRQAGVAAHRRHGARVRRSGLLLIVGVALLLAALLLALAAS